MHREGYAIVFSFLAASLVTSLMVWAGVPGIALKILLVLLWALTAFSVYFFRDPNRDIPQDPNAILSPADGKVIEISEAEEPEFLKHAREKLVFF